VSPADGKKKGEIVGLGVGRREKTKFLKYRQAIKKKIENR